MQSQELTKRMGRYTKPKATTMKKSKGKGGKKGC